MVTVPVPSSTGELACPQLRFRWSGRLPVGRIEHVYEAGDLGEQGAPSPVEGALLAWLSPADVGDVQVRRPRGSWVYEAVHGRRGHAGLVPGGSAATED